MSEWYYSKNNQQQGPVSEEQLKLLAASGQLQPSNLVWKEGMSQWAEARKMDGLFQTQDIANPPPLPAGVSYTTMKSGMGASAVQGHPGNSTGLIAAGYICGGLSLLIFPPAFGLAGIVCGIVNLVRGSTGHGIAQIVISVICTLFGMAIGAAMVQ